MRDRNKIVLIAVLTIALVGLLVRSLFMLKAVSSKAPTKKEIAQAPAPAPPTPPTAQPLSQIAGLSLALPPRNPFSPLISEKKETTPPPPSTTQPPPHLPAPVISQAPPGQAQPLSTNLTLMGTVLGTLKVAVIKVGEKSFIVRQGERIDGLTLKKVDRGRVIFEGLEGEITLKGGEPE